MLPHVKNDADSERRQSVALLIFAVVRIIGWMILAVCVGAGLLHIGGFHWSKVLAESVPFVVMISIYANWATDLDAATAAFAALVASDSRRASDRNRKIINFDQKQLLSDISLLASLSPGEESDRIVAEITKQVSGVNDSE